MERARAISKVPTRYAHGRYLNTYVITNNRSSASSLHIHEVIYVVKDSSSHIEVMQL